jgi:hypothetical protein
MTSRSELVKSATATSGFPSPLKSAISIAKGLPLTGTALDGANWRPTRQ